MESVLSHKILPDTMKDVSYVDTNLEQKESILMKTKIFFHYLSVLTLEKKKKQRTLIKTNIFHYLSVLTLQL